MSHELKFRVWDKANNKFINPFKFEWNDYYKTTGMVLLDLNGKIRIADYSSGNGDNSASSVYSEVDNPDNYIVQEYTGLTDSKETEICEGDILEWKGEFIAEVFFEKENAAFVIKSKKGGKAFMSENYALNFQIIGNIFEHKHLLEK